MTLIITLIFSTGCSNSSNEKLLKELRGSQAEQNRTQKHLENIKNYGRNKKKAKIDRGFEFGSSEKYEFGSSEKYEFGSSVTKSKKYKGEFDGVYKKVMKSKHHLFFYSALIS
jgi:hypothetical protein